MPIYLKRIIAYLIDIGLAMVPVYIYIRFLGKKNSNGDFTVKEPIGIILIFFSVFVYYVLQEFYFHKTIGKRIFNLKIIKVDSSKLSLADVIKRHMFDIFELIFLSPLAFLVSITNKKYQRIGDFIAKTQVVSEVNVY